MNSFGNLFKVTSFGESHGSMVGCVIDTCPAGLTLNLEAIQSAVDKRKTNQQNFASQRNEEDKVEIASGIFEGKTLGSPIAIFIKNKDANSSDYEALKNVYRPSHADYTNHLKYGLRDYRGGGRSSIRITAPLVAAGEIARQCISHYTNMRVVAFVSQIGSVKMQLDNNFLYQRESIEASVLRCPDSLKSKEMQLLIDEMQKQGDTLGGCIHVQIQEALIGLGEPIFGKLQAELSHAMFAINTVKGIEFGNAFSNVSLTGSQLNDSFTNEHGAIKTESNNNAGIQGGISNGELIHFTLAFKPISSIQREQKTVDEQGKQVEVSIKGRHDVCALPRAVSIVEAYTNIVLINLLLQNKLSRI